MTYIEPKDKIIIERVFVAPIERVFKALITTEDLVRWHHAGDGWKTPYAELDPRVGGVIKIGYSDAEGKSTFDFTATITDFNEPYRLAYRLHVSELIEEDSRLVEYDLSEENGKTKLRVQFDIEHVHDKELQRKGWSEHYEFLDQLLKEEQ